MNLITFVAVSMPHSNTVLTCLRSAIPALYRQCAVCYTDFWSAYNQIFPDCRPRAVSKTSGKTNGIEREARRMIESSRQTSRFNCTSSTKSFTPG